MTDPTIAVYGEADRRRSHRVIPQRRRSRPVRHRDPELDDRAQRGLPPERPIEFRIGIHLGDVVNQVASKGAQPCQRSVLVRSGQLKSCLRPAVDVHVRCDAAQVWPQLVARHPSDALDLDHKLGVNQGLAVRPVRDRLLGSSRAACPPTLLQATALAALSRPREVAVPLPAR